MDTQHENTTVHNNEIDITGNILINITQYKNSSLSKEQLNTNILFTLLLFKQDQHTETFTDFYLPISQISYSQENNFYISNTVNRGNIQPNQSNIFNNDDIDLEFLDISVDSNNLSNTSSDFKNNTTSYSNSIHNNTQGIYGNSEHTISFFQNPLHNLNSSSNEETSQPPNPLNPSSDQNLHLMSINLLSLLNTFDIYDEHPLTSNSASNNSELPKGNSPPHNETSITPNEQAVPLNITINKQKLAKGGKRYYLYQKQLDFYLTNIGKDYLNLMMEHYNNIQNQISELFDEQMCKNLFTKLFKCFLLEFGISHKQFYQEILRQIAFQRDKITFSDFVRSFDPILELKMNVGLIKMRFLLFIFQVDKGNCYLTLRELHIFFMMIKRKLPYEEEISDEICEDLIRRYECFFYNEEKYNLIKGKYNIKKLATVLETFYMNDME